MTDEDDDRMDRARRIREMREGTREAQSDDHDDADDTADADGTDARESPDDASADPDGTDQPEGASEETDDPSGSPTAVGATDPTAGDDPAVGVDGGGSLTISGTEVEDVEVDVEELAEQAGLDPGELDPDEERDAASPVGMAGASSVDQVETADETRVLEFDLGSERYCLDIDHVEEIVKREAVTRVPNTPEYVEGVVDLRGQITTILDPKVLLDIDDEGSKELIVVFDPEEFEDQGAIGWIVDDVNQVTPVVDEEVNDSPVDADHINGVVERDGEFVVWTQPDVAIEKAAG